jgi:hypothetical protein
MASYDVARSSEGDPDTQEQMSDQFATTLPSGMRLEVARPASVLLATS